MAEKDNGEKEFFKELDTFKFRMPGNAQIPFSENQVVLQIIGEQYPRWKDLGKITSVPVARVPKLFLHGSQLEKLLQKQLRSVSAGDEGEIKLYRLFVDGNFMGQAGTIVFPNVDASHIFKCQVAKVEIDMVLIHSKKGIFVFNVKNQGGKGTPAKKVKENIETHSNFIRMLKNYKSTEDNCFTPIHTVICDFEKTKFGNLETNNENAGEHIIVLNKKDLETANFMKIWVSRIAKISDVVWNTSLDVLVARLIALASIEGAASLIHEQMTAGVLQSTNKKEYLECQLGSFENNSNIKEIVAEHSEIENRKRKKRFILWTKAQMAVIAKVFNHVTTSHEQGLRLLVTGGKGTGKTMLLIFLAKMVQRIAELQTGESTSRTVVIEGTRQSNGLIQVLKQALCSSNVTVFDYIVEYSSMDSLINGFLSDNERKSFVETLLQGHFILWDEHIDHSMEVLEMMTCFSSCQHFVLFMSYPIGHKEWWGFEVMHLDACLRSTGQLATFANNLVNVLECRYYSTHPSRSFEGERVDIKFSGETGDKISFMSLSVKTIVEYAQKMHDADFLPVANLLEKGKLHLIKEGLEKLNYTCFIDVMPTALEDREPTDVGSVKSPVILFFAPRKYIGFEFPVVLILMDKLTCITKIEKERCFINVFTRASLSLVVIFDESSPPEEEMKRAVLADRINFMEDAFCFGAISPGAKPMLLIVGRCPDKVGHFKRELYPPQMYLPDVEGISCYVGCSSRVLHVDDVYLESDLKKLQDFGIKIFAFVNAFVECEWFGLYSAASLKCFDNLKKKASNVFLLPGPIWSSDERSRHMKRLLAFLKQQSGQSAIKIPVLGSGFRPQTMPEIDSDWSKWKSKAEELFRIHQTGMACKLYHRSIRLLEREFENDMQQGNVHGTFKHLHEKAKLYTNISKIHLEQTDGICNGKINPGVDFWTEILNAFYATKEAMWSDPLWSRSYERMHAIVKKLKDRFYSCSTDSCDSHFSYRANLPNFLDENVSVLSQKTNFLNELDELYVSIELCRKTTDDKSDSQLRSTISSKAATLSQESLELFQLRDVQYGSDRDTMLNNRNSFRLLANQAVFIFEISVRLAMISSKYSFQTKSPEEVLPSALNKLKDVLSRIKELGSFVRLYRDESN